MRGYWRWISLGFLCLALAGCDASTVHTTATATTAPTATTALSPTATVTLSVATPVAFSCVTTVNNSEKVFTDSTTGLSFGYPASWTEADCQRTVSADGSQSLLIGNLFNVSVFPRNGLTIQQWVNQQAGNDETVTLTKFTAAHAVEADSVSVTTIGQPTQPPAFSQTIAIVAGSQSFYEVTGLVAQISMTDTIPPLSHGQLLQQVVTTFDVP